MTVTPTAHHCQPPSEFLVEIDVALPPALPAEERDRLLARERARGAELVAEGSIVRIWRIPGTTNNVGVWAAADADALHERLASLPMFPYATVRVRALTRHPLERPAG